jgi:hypothetical protein
MRTYAKATPSTGSQLVLKLKQNIITCLLEDVHRNMRQQDLRVHSSTYEAYISSYLWMDEAGHIGTTLLLI